jgi:enamine deaminase RidA (YjgF/YER057c/UK114 family)
MVAAAILAGSGATATSAPHLISIEPDEKIGTSRAVVVDDTPLVHTAQLLPLNQSGELVAKGNITEQTSKVLGNLRMVLNANKSELQQVVKLNVYLARAEDLPSVQKVLAETIVGPLKPASCFVIGVLSNPDALVAMDAVAIAGLPEPGIKPISKPALYEQRGIRSAATLPAGSKVYVSGMADTNDLPVATRRTLEKLASAIDHLGIDRKDIVQLKAFLQPMSEAWVVTKAIADFFDGNAPPTVLVEWISPPPNPPIEIELIAAAKQDAGKEMNSVSFLTPPGTTSTKVFSRVVRINHGQLIYFSGLHGRMPNDPGAQIKDIFRSIEGLLATKDSDMEHLVKATYYVSDDEASNKLNEIRPEYFKPESPPAASKAKVRSTGFADKSIMIDMIAVTR